MPINYELSGFSGDLREFKISLEAVDIDSVKEKALKRAADEMVDMVVEAIQREDKIESPAMNSKYERGPGSSIGNPNAWRVEQEGSKWIVRPGKAQRKRATVLNYGYPGTIDAGGDVMGFEVNGVPVFTREVEGPDETGYWQKAYQQMRSSDRLTDILEEELEEEFEEKFR